MFIPTSVVGLLVEKNLVAWRDCSHMWLSGLISTDLTDHLQRNQPEDVHDAQPKMP